MCALQSANFELLYKDIFNSEPVHIKGLYQKHINLVFLSNPINLEQSLDAVDDLFIYAFKKKIINRFSRDPAWLKFFSSVALLRTSSHDVLFEGMYGYLYKV